LPRGISFKSNHKWPARFLRRRYFNPASLAGWRLARGEGIRLVAVSTG